MSQAHVTVILSTHNRAKALARVLADMAAQDWRPLGVVLIDDGSTDGTRERLPEWREQSKAAGIAFTYRRQRPAGAAAAWNRGLRIAAGMGEYICCLNSEDLWRPRLVSTLMRLFEQHPSAGVAFCECDRVDAQGREVRRGGAAMPGPLTHGVLTRPEAEVVHGLPLNVAGAIVRREVFERVGEFDASLGAGHAWDFWCRAAREFDFAYSTSAHACCVLGPAVETAEALAAEIEVALKQVSLASKAEARRVLEARVTRCSARLQELMLRQRRDADDGRHAALLRNPFAARSLRFRLASAAHRSHWAAGAYGGMVRALRWVSPKGASATRLT